MIATNRIRLFLLAFFIVSNFIFSQDNTTKLKYNWPLFVYNFGGLDKFTIEDQVKLVQQYGYDGMAIDVANATKLAEYEKYAEAAKKIKNFKIYTVFYRLHYDEKIGFSKDWAKVIDKIAGTGTDLWLITGEKKESISVELLEKEIRAVVDYAAKQSVQVTLYPHSKNYIATAEEALVYVKKINKPNFNLAFHSCHELRAGNANRIEEVLEKVKDHLGYVTIAGADNIPNTTSNGSDWEASTLKPLYRGNFDVNRILKKLKKLNYKGSIGFINHRITESPEVYLPLSKTTYSQWITQLNALPSSAFDAPDQSVWHSESKTWFVSNLGGGISLDKDNYGWISRLDASGFGLGFKRKCMPPQE
jgi:sugar phosphate isomerase/epimerase